MSESSCYGLQQQSEQCRDSGGLPWGELGLAHHTWPSGRSSEWTGSLWISLLSHKSLLFFLFRLVNVHWLCFLSSCRTKRSSAPLHATAPRPPRSTAPTLWEGPLLASPPRCDQPTSSPHSRCTPRRGTATMEGEEKHRGSDVSETSLWWQICPLSY